MPKLGTELPQRLLLLLALLVLVVALALRANVDALAASPAAIPLPWKNCAAVNKKYPHGVGKAKAKDKTTGVPVTTFKRSTRLYNIAMSHNRGLDRDKDGIACETR